MNLSDLPRPDDLQMPGERDWGIRCVPLVDGRFEPVSVDAVDLGEAVIRSAEKFVGIAVVERDFVPVNVEPDLSRDIRRPEPHNGTRSVNVGDEIFTDTGCVGPFQHFFKIRYRLLPEAVRIGEPAGSSRDQTAPVVGGELNHTEHRVRCGRQSLQVNHFVKQGTRCHGFVSAFLLRVQTGGTENDQ